MQSSTPAAPDTAPFPADIYEKYFVPLALLLGLALRFYQASTTYLNPDECWTLYLSRPGDWATLLLDDTHPILTFFLLHHLQAINHSEIFLRLPFLLAGWLFPWIILRWLQRLQFSIAAWAAFLFLELSPNLIALSAQVRGYMLAMLFTALALYFLEFALEKRSIPCLGLSSLFLYLAILSEFCVAFATAALGVYAFSRLVFQSAPLRFTLAWVVSQLGALSVYYYLYVTQISLRLADRKVLVLVEQYLILCFPRLGQGRIAFSIQAIVNQFKYLASSNPAGWLFFFLFLLGLFVIWRVWLPEGKKTQLWPLALSVLAAIGVALFAALYRIHPLGPSRHNIILALFTVIPVALAIQWIFDRLPRLRPLALPALALATIALYALAIPDPQNIHPNRHSLQSMNEAIQQIEEQIPKGSIILMDEETAWILSYYLERKPVIMPGPGAPKLHRYRFSSYRTYGRHWFFDSFDTITKDIATLRRLENIPPTQPIYVLDTGFVQLPPAAWNARELSSSMLLLLPE